jgi:V/A-type H+-transporting ATPase subunit I
MTIVGLKKITLYGPVNEKAQILEEMQNRGCLHIIPLIVRENILDKSSSFANIREALKYLQNCPTKLKSIKEVENFDPADLEGKILHNKRESEQLIAESDSLKKKIADLKPWGNFVLPDSKEIGDQKLWFYLVAHHEMKKFHSQTICMHQANRKTARRDRI